MIRIRIWQDPYDEAGNVYGGGMNDLQTVIEIAGRASANGMNFLLDFHYSDFWADPAKQMKPKAWKHLEGKALETAVYLHTVDTLKALKNRNLVPAMVQVGNEITNGLLWPDGNLEHTDAMFGLLKTGTDNKMYRKWFDMAEAVSLDYDVIGMSFYPHWNGSLEKLLYNMNDVSARYGKEVLVAKTSIGYTTDSLGCKGIVFHKEQEEATGYPATKEGQKEFLKDLYATVRSVQDQRGIGVFYWEPAWLPIPECKWSNPNGIIYMHDKAEAGNAMGNQALFDEKGNANQALLELKVM